MLDFAHIRVGLLDTIPADFYLEGEASDPRKFMDMFAAAGLKFTYTTYHVAEGERPASIDECDAWLITGSPCSVYEDLPWIPVLEDFIRKAYAAAQPQVGVCFGHQIVAQALGGHVAKADTGWVLGRHHLQVNIERGWMPEILDEYTLHYINQDQVIDLPPGVQLIGESPRCPNALYEAEGRVLCIQPHPEQPVSSMQIFSDVLLERGSITEAEHADCYATLESGTADSTLVARWLGRFIIDNVMQQRGG